MREEPVRNAANIGRRIRAHTKSRAGCKNCKIRKVKCDETKPGCKRCHLYGVRCDYGSKNLLEPYLRAPPANSTDSHVLSAQKCSPIKTMLAMINNAIEASPQADSKSLSSFRLEVEDLNRLERFQSRTILSVGTPITGPVYQEQIIKLVCQHPYLLHAVMTVTCMHDRYMRNETRSLIESYHYGQSAALFRRKLSQDVPASDHDGLWATCALLGTISIFAIDAATPEEAWPLKSSPTDLEWLGVLDGIHVVWGIVQPTRTGSAFERLSDDRSKAVLLASKDPVLIEGTEHLPKTFIKLCNITEHSTADNNPYLPPLNNLAPLLEMECTQNTFLCYLAFTGRMTSAYKQLLHVKDPRALLILAYWYAKLCHEAPWFLKHRAMIECRSICSYLERYHTYHGGIQALLEFPKTECGLLPSHNQPLTPVSLVSLSSSSREYV